MSNITGQSLGRYHILEPLGEGGMAIVYKAYDTRLESDVAVKVIRIERLSPEILQKALKRFEREAKSLAQLTHPNIVKVLDYGEHEGQPYLVMPYLPGGTLKQLLNGKPMPWQTAARLLIPIGRALEYAHKRGLVHRDIKPSNILITESGEPMLSDFGIAKIIDEEITMDLTGTSATVGTPEYMAPEQVTSKTVDHRADIYALGVVFYEMVTGHKPYRADTPMAVMFKHASEPLPNPRQFVPNLPENVVKVLLKALAKKPEDRYQDISMMAVALENVLHNVGAFVTGSALYNKNEVDDTLATFEQGDTYSTQPQEATYHEAKRLSTTITQDGIARNKNNWLPWAVILGGTGIVAMFVVIVVVLVIAFSNSGTSSTPTTTQSLPTSFATVIQEPLLLPSTALLETTLLPSATAEPTPQMFGFETCLQPCNGSNATRSFPEYITKINVRWSYANIPANVSYVRVWTQAGREWVRYECNWPNPSSGTESVTLTEPSGLHSGEWVIKVYINNQLLLNESIFVEGNLTYWDPAGTFNSCYGKK